MTPEDVLKIYNNLATNNIAVIIDGGWCVDALLGRQTRDHPDLDLAVDRKYATQLKELLTDWDYEEEHRNDTSEWNYAMRDSEGHLVDIHVYEFDDQGNNIYGIEYPRSSLTGIGTINNQKVGCISPEWMFKFKTGYEPKDKDLSDIQALSHKFGFELPDRKSF